MTPLAWEVIFQRRKTLLGSRVNRFVQRRCKTVDFPSRPYGGRSTACYPKSSTFLFPSGRLIARLIRRHRGHCSCHTQSGVWWPWQSPGFSIQWWTLGVRHPRPNCFRGTRSRDTHERKGFYLDSGHGREPFSRAQPSGALLWENGLIAVDKFDLTRRRELKPIRLSHQLTL